MSYTILEAVPSGRDVEGRYQSSHTARHPITDEGAHLIWVAYHSLYGSAWQSMDKRQARGGIAWVSEIEQWRKDGQLPVDFDWTTYKIQP